MTLEKKDYRKSVNLPRPDFPMRAGLPENEPKRRFRRIPEAFLVVLGKK
jgi:hypothetical protein